jgi:hypothetical protein
MVFKGPINMHKHAGTPFQLRKALAALPQRQPIRVARDGRMASLVLKLY